MNVHDLVIELNGYELDAYATYELEKGCKGSRNEYGVPMEPDTYDQVNINQVFVELESDKKFTEIDLPSIVIEEYEQEILEELQA